MSKLQVLSVVSITALLFIACSPQPATPEPTTTPASQAPPTAEAESRIEATRVPPPAVAGLQFSTDFSQHSVPFSDILSGGPPKDGIPSIDDPAFVSISEADAWLEPNEPVVFFQLGEDARAYPIQILMWHEIVNDVVDGTPVLVSFCPLCNTAIAFERVVEGQELEFGTTGRLRYSNLIMYDRQTESWWQQATGEAIVGEFTGTRLTFLPASIIAWTKFRAAHPDGLVLSRETGFNREYGRNPYTGYDDINNSPFLYDGPSTPDTLPPVARVLTIDLHDEAVAYPYSVLEQVGVVNDTVGETDVVVMWAPGTASALDAGTVAGGRDVGAAAAFQRELQGRILTFARVDGQIIDQETGSTWNLFGRAISGELVDSQLEPVVAIDHLWFSWAAFRPETRVYTAP